MLSVPLANAANRETSNSHNCALLQAARLPEHPRPYGHFYTGNPALTDISLLDIVIESLYKPIAREKAEGHAKEGG
jgi:hypothetical protein